MSTTARVPVPEHSDVFPFFCPEAVLKLKVTAHSKPHPCLHCPKICPDGESREVLLQKAGSLFSKAAAIMKTKEKARMKEALDDFGLSLC